MTATVIAMQVASLVGVSAAVARNGADPSGPPLTVPIITYLMVDGAGDLVVFDLGCAAQGDPVQGRPVVQDHRTVAEAVSSAGYDPVDVGVVVVSHLHWDHCVGMADFPRARLLVQRAELDFASSPPAQQEAQYDAPSTGRRARWLDDLDRIDVTHGDGQLTPDLQILHTPGHTAGSQSLLVKARENSYLLCGDLFMSFDQWQAPAAERVAPGLLSSLDDWHRSMARVEKLGAVPLPAHEPRVFEVLAGGASPRA